MSNSLQHKMLWGGELLSAILVLLFILVVSACQNDAPKAAALRIHIIDGLSSSKTVMPDGFRGVDQYELVIADQSGFEIARSTATGSVDALVSGIVPGQYTITVNGYADIGSEPVLIINDSQPLTVKDGMTEVSVAVSGIAEGTGTVDLSITAEMPEGYMFADDAVTVRLYDGGEAVYTTTVGYTVTDGAMTARLEDDIEAGVYTAEVQVDELYGRVMLYALPGMRSTGTIAVNPMIAEKVATPVIEEEYNSEYQYEIGDTIMVDGIECLVGYDAQSEQEWGRYILIDKKHDLSYYTRGSDFYNDLYITDDINTCEWGELTAGNYYDIDSHWGQYPIIEGKQNTQAILQVIESNGVPDGDYLSIWDDLLVFYESHSNEWFIPSFEEFSWILGNVYSVDRDLFENLSDDGETYYATSSEINESTAAVVDIGGRYDSVYKSDPFCRVRLCRYLSEDENMIVISEDADNVDIFYTTDGSTPDKTSILYLKPFIADEGTTIKAIAFNDGMMPSDVAEYATGYLYDNLTHWQLSNGQKINEAGHTLVWVFDDSTHKHEECNICDYKTDPIYVPPIL